MGFNSGVKGLNRNQSKMNLCRNYWRAWRNMDCS